MKGGVAVMKKLVEALKGKEKKKKDCCKIEIKEQSDKNQ